MGSEGESQVRQRSGDESPVTRGGWTPSGTAAERRATYSKRGTKRGHRTRGAIVAAARKVFEQAGFSAATVEDIVLEAGVARGSFYTYFPDKMAVFRDVYLDLRVEFRQAIEEVSPGPGTTLERLAASNAQYIDAYRRNAKLRGLIEQEAMVDEVIHASWLASRTANSSRIATQIRRWQALGKADPEVDPDVTAALLLSMSSHFCFVWFVGGEEWEQTRAAAALTAGWVGVLGLRDTPDEAWVRALG